MGPVWVCLKMGRVPNSAGFLVMRFETTTRCLPSTTRHLLGNWHFQVGVVFARVSFLSNVFGDIRVTWVLEPVYLWLLRHHKSQQLAFAEE